MFKLNIPNTEVSRLLDKPCSRIWQVLTDTALWPKWGPSVREVECGDHFIREGSSGKIRTPAGIWVPFIITRYEEGRYWSWEVSGVAATGHRIEPGEEGSCRLIFEVPLIAVPYTYVCRIALDRIARLLGEDTHT